ncbi:unnamed protein product [marine sediment metagenome]|uniref:Uncharacterized protein n=1 Tax=marine sediment metagenome TaxID=412755 RepID=X1D2L4_9ZZZZ
MLKLISDEKLAGFKRTIGVSFNESRHIAQAQLEADQKVLDATERNVRKEVGEWMKRKMVATPLYGVEWHFRLDEVETFLRGEMPK